MNASREAFPNSDIETDAREQGARPTTEEPGGLLIVDDDETCCWAMRRAFERRGYAVRVAHSVTAALELVNQSCPQYVLVDLRMPGQSGLSLVAQLREASPCTRIVVLTGYSSIATAVDAIRLGAIDYLVKPVSASAVEAALLRTSVRPKVEAPCPEEVPSVDRLAWEHIQRTLSQFGGNVSATARALGMHRRTLQRKLNKHPARR